MKRGMIIDRNSEGKYLLMFKNARECIDQFIEPTLKCIGRTHDGRVEHMVGRAPFNIDAFNRFLKSLGIKCIDLPTINVNDISILNKNGAKFRIISVPRLRRAYEGWNDYAEEVGWTPEMEKEFQEEEDALIDDSIARAMSFSMDQRGLKEGDGEGGDFPETIGNA